MMAAGLSPTGLITSAVISTLVSHVNSALGASADAPVLTVSDSGSGISLALALPGEPAIALDNLTTDGGLGGRLHIDDIPAGGLSASLFGDFTVALTSFDLTLAQGAFVSTDIAGALTIPDFTGSGNDQTVDIEVAIRADGSLAVTLAAQQSDPSTMTPDGLVALNFSLADGVGALDLAVSTLEITETSGTWSLTLTGSLTLTTEDISWPEVDLRGLSIDSAGNVSLQGGWISLPSQAAIDFYGFHVALQRLGFGSTGGDKWIGFDADVNLVEGVSLGGSVRGLQVNLGTGAVTFAGISVDFEIPGVLSFTGEIDHASIQSAADLAAAGLPSNFPIPAQVFAGGVDLSIEAAGDLEIDAQFIVAQVPNPIPANGQPAPPGTPTQTCFFLSLDAELPVGIPLFADVSLYGMSGMFAANLRPDIGTATWWDWYKYPTAADGTPDTTNLPDLQGGNGAPDYTATDVFKWLHPVSGAFALGAGAVIGTMDDGFTASASISFMIILPGPVIVFIGKANILSKRISGPADEANFEAMATYDGTKGTFDLVIDAQYSIPVVLDVQAEAELYTDPGAGVWFLAIGKPPHEQRVKARVLDLFECDLYFVVSNTGLVTGFWIGYQNSWSFGPLSASVNAYLTANAAIQWSPLQLAAEAELHGEVHLSAFGFSLGITADALLAATAPSPWWVYGSLSVELDLPWPLPNVGGTIALSWGGNGPPPPAPLALNTVGATLVDHGASDHYELLAHRAGATVNAVDPADTVVYDPPPPAKPGTPGILAAIPSGYWAGQPQYNPVTLPDDPSAVVPDLDPAQLARAPLVPQDSHFALSFAHPVADQAGFNGAVTPPKEIVAVPPAVGVDDLPGPTPPAVQWSIRHTLLEVALYRYDALTTPASWQLVAAAPKSVNGWAVAAPLALTGAWVAADPVKQVPAPGTALKVAPYTVLSGEPFTVAWGGPQETLGTSFTDQGLQYDCGPGLLPATIAAPWPGQPTGLCFQLPGVIIQIADQAGAQDASSGEVTITFPSAIVLTGLTGVAVVGGANSPNTAPQVPADGQPLTPTSVQPSAGPVYTLAFDPAGPAVTQLQLAVDAAGPTYLLGLSYATPEINMPILPQAPGLYALKAVTRIEAGQVDGSGNVGSYQPVTDGNPVIEFAYLQCASGPGTATIGPPAASGGFTDPLPYRQPPFPDLAEPASSGSPLGTSPAQSPANAFPAGGRLNDLSSYTQWSWPGDGDAAAYYGYDLDVEFNETYVNALYATFLALAAPWDYQNSELPPAVHIRCVDRNQRYTLLQPIATHVPSIYPQSATVNAVLDPPLPTTIAQNPPAPASGRTGPGGLVGRLPAAIARALAIGAGAGDVSAASIAAARSILAARPGAAAASGSAATAAPALNAAIAAAGLTLQPASVAAAVAVSPQLRAILLGQLSELADAATARSLWFAPLAPQTRYTADVVAGPLRVSSRDKAGAGTLQAIYQAGDATAALAALRAYQAEEAALTTLQRVQFATSRYATFSDHVANLLAQVAGTTQVPVRRYAVPNGVDPQAWLAAAAAEQNRETAAGAYRAARRLLADIVARFDPLFDVNQPAPLADPTSGNGQQALAAQRAVTEKAWQAFASAASATFDGLVAALGQPGLVSSAKVPPPPDTELSVLAVGAELPVVALLITSPEPLAWRRMWQWTSLAPYGGFADGLTGVTVLWSADQTRALLVPLGTPIGQYTLNLGFQGDIGAETACITTAGASVSETATTAPLVLARRRIYSR